MNKIINPGKGRYGEIYCKITYIDGKLSISGVEGPQTNGDCKGGYGQIIDRLNVIMVYGKGWNRFSLHEFVEIWKEWHLKEVPKSVLESLEAFPETPRKPAWV